MSEVIKGAAKAAAVAALWEIGGAVAFGESILWDMVVSKAAQAAGISLLGQILSGGAKDNQQSFTAEAQSRSIMIRSPIGTHRWIYGQARVSGNLVYAQTTGTDPKYLHLVIVLAGHEIAGIDEVLLDAEAVGTLDANGYPVAGRFTKRILRNPVEGFTIPTTPPYTVTVSGAAEMTGHNGVSIFDSGLDGFAPIEETAGAPTASGQYQRSGGTYTFHSSDAGRDVRVSYSMDYNKGYVRVRKFLGTATQTADPDLIAETGEWRTTDRWLGRAYVYLRFEKDVDIFPTGLPSRIQFDVRGAADVYDPRGPSTGYSNNAPLCVLHYLRHPAGLAIDTSEYDAPSWIAAANVADEAVTLRDGSTQSRYTCNGTFTLDAAPFDIIQQLLTSMAGAAVWSMGKWYGYAGADLAAVGSLTDSDARGPVTFRPRPSRQSLFNAVRGTFTDPANNWLLTEFPPVTNATYEAQDGGARIYRDVELPFTNHVEASQRLAKIELERARQGIVVQFPAKLSALRLLPRRVVNLTLAIPGWTAKPFLVLEWKLSLEGEPGVDLVLQEYSASMWDWAAGEATTRDPAPDTSLPDPFVCAPPANVMLASGADELVRLASGAVLSRIRVTWDRSADAYVTGAGRAQLQYRPTGETDWTDAQTVAGDGAAGYVTNVIDQHFYDVRVRFENSIGVRSDWVTVSGHRVVGKSEPPSNVASFTIDGMRLSWASVGDVDIAGYVIRYQPGINRSWGDAIAMHEGLVTESPWTPEVLPVGQVTIMICARDTTGNQSGTPAVIVTDLGDPVVANVVESFDRRADGFPGTQTGCAVSGGDLVANTTNLMWRPDDAAAMWDDVSSNLMWAATTYEQLVYEDRLTITAAIAGSRLTIDAAIAGDPWSIEYRENSSNPMWNVDDTVPMWGADDTAPAWYTPDWQSWPGAITVSNSIYDFRITAGQAASQGVISGLTFVVDAPDIVEYFNDVAIGGAGTRLTLTQTYRVIKNVQLTLQADGGAAISARADDKSATLGPLVKCLDAAGTVVAGTVDAIVQGY